LAVRSVWRKEKVPVSETETTEAVVLAVLVADQVDSLISRQVAEVKVGLEGFSGDKHAGFTRRADGRTPEYPRGTHIRNDRQVSLVSREELQQVAERLELAEIQPEWLGANLLLGSIPGLSALPHNTRLRFSEGVVLVVQAENMPCVGPGRVIAAQTGRAELEREFPRAALHLRGLVAVVERGGTLRLGEHVAVSRRRDSQGDP
jgi:MOSC domain-containing protein YiiM